MPTPPLSDELAQEAVQAWWRHQRAYAPAAEELGLTVPGFRNRLQRAIDRGFLTRDDSGQLKPASVPPRADAPVTLPDFPDDDAPIEDIIAMMERRFEKRRAAYDAHAWFPVQVPDDKPIGILWFGDPHVDDNGCNWSLLRQHCQICDQTEGLYGANIGDTTNNWHGKLIRLYANQDSSVKTARRLAKWFMLESGVRWLLWLIGNHDAWGDGAEILTRMGANGTQKVVCHDWDATFRLVFPNGWEPRVYAAHDFPGNSQWNPLHGPMKMGQMGVEADLYVCGHKHNSAEFGFENAARGIYQHFVRVRGYKFMDEYARRIGKTEQKHGSGCLTIFDPRDRTITRHMDIEKGAAFLTSLRQSG